MAFSRLLSSSYDSFMAAVHTFVHRHPVATAAMSLVAISYAVPRLIRCFTNGDDKTDANDPHRPFLWWSVSATSERQRTLSLCGWICSPATSRRMRLMLLLITTRSPLRMLFPMGIGSQQHWAWPGKTAMLFKLLPKSWRTMSSKSSSQSSRTRKRKRMKIMSLFIMFTLNEWSHLVLGFRHD